MAICFSSCKNIIWVVVILFVRSCCSRKLADEFQTSSSDKTHLQHHLSGEMDPSTKVFFTINDLKIGKKIPIYFPYKNPEDSPHLLSRQEANSIPFSLSQLPYLLDFFSISKDSQQAKGIEYTLRQCEAESNAESNIEEAKICATSLESMLDFARTTFGFDTQLKVLTTNYVNKPVKPLQNYTILEEPKEILAKKTIGCHIMPYPFVVYYCHSREGGNRVFEVLLSGETGERFEAAAICHMDTSQWDKDHVAFQILNIKPGSSPVCHFFQADNVLWVPLEN